MNRWPKGIYEHTEQDTFENSRKRSLLSAESQEKRC